MKIWIIGGTSGIGQAVSMECAGKGHDVSSSGIKYDVKDPGKLGSFWEQFGPFDAVVYSAGVNQLGWIEELDDKTVLDIYDTNVVGFMRLLQLIKKKNAGAVIGHCQSIVAISSDAAERPMRTSIAYCASKAALNMAVRVAAREMAPLVRVNAIAPGVTENTIMTAYVDAVVPAIRGWRGESAAEYERSQIPMGRRAEPAEVARVTYDVLTGPEYLTGSVITVNGGR